MGLQSNYELQKARVEAERPLAKITPLWHIKNPATQRGYALRRDAKANATVHVADLEQDAEARPSPASDKKTAAAGKAARKTPLKRAKKASARRR